MNPERFGLHEILRYFFSGSVAFVGFVWTIGIGTVPAIPGGVTSTSGIAMLTLLASTSGAILYSSYRALLYVFVGRIAFGFALLVRLLPEWIKYVLPCTTPACELKRDKWRWKERSGGKEGKPRLDEWASQIHLLYTSSLGLYIGALIGHITQCKHIPTSLTIVACIGVAAAFISDVRRRCVEEDLYRRRG